MEKKDEIPTAEISITGKTILSHWSLDRCVAILQSFQIVPVVIALIN